MICRSVIRNKCAFATAHAADGYRQGSTPAQPLFSHSQIFELTIICQSVSRTKICKGSDDNVTVFATHAAVCARAGTLRDFEKQLWCQEQLKRSSAAWGMRSKHCNTYSKEVLGIHQRHPSHERRRGIPACTRCRAYMIPWRTRSVPLPMMHKAKWLWATGSPLNNPLP